MTELNYTTELLNQLKINLLITVFDQCHMKLSIIEKSKKPLQIKVKLKNDKMRNSLNINCQKFKDHGIWPAYDFDVKLSPEILNDVRMDKEIDTLKNLLKFICNDLSESEERRPLAASIDHLNVAIETLQNDFTKFQRLQEELQFNKTRLKELKYGIKQTQAESEQILKAKNERIRDLRHELLNIQLIHRIEMNLIEKWSTNRQTQLELYMEREKRTLIQQLLSYKRDIATEKRLIAEVICYRKNELHELNDSCRKWQMKLKCESENVSREIDEILMKISTLQQQHEHYQQLHQEQITFIENYFHYKAEQQRLYEEECYRLQCIVRIQAWWRGIMVRQGLGPYRKKSKSKSKAKNVKGKNK